MRKLPSDGERGVLGNPAASPTESPSTVTVPSSFCTGSSHQARGAWSKYRAIRFKRVKSAGVAFPTARLHSLQSNAISGLSDARHASLADTL